jgi:hypothetical protein
LTRYLHGALTLFALVFSVATASAQQPTQAQASAIKSACRGDYMNVCASVPTGGMAALQCLQQHSSQVSGGCQSALAAVGGSAPGAPQGGGFAPQQNTAPAAMAPPGGMPMRSEIRLLRADCGYDYERFCRGVQPGGGRALECLLSYRRQLQPMCRSALRAAMQSR